MTVLIHRLAIRAGRALATTPRVRGWVETAAVGAAVGAVGYLLGRRTGLFQPTPAPPPSLAAAASILLTPALGEELWFRAVLTPSRDEQPSHLAALLPSTTAFTAWHVLTALTILPRARRLFLRPDFLALAALEGLACGWLRRRTGSVWPGVVLHWAEVLVWKTWLGGPALADLAQAPGSVGSSSRRHAAISR
jgi:predicted Abi (CAAX) family protease